MDIPVPQNPKRRGASLPAALQDAGALVTRLLGRSAWNSRWKLVIPGQTLLNNPDEGLERLIRTLTDVKLYFHTYSYSGN